MGNVAKILIPLIALLLFMFSYEAYHSKNYVSLISGYSMTQYGIREGDLTTVHVNREPIEGDIINFRCTNKEKCPTYDMAKKLKDINEQGCYWVEGNDDPWYDIKSGQRKYSLDSRMYGWLCKNDIKLNGVVEKNDNSPVRESFVDAKCVPPTREDTFHEAVCKRP